MIARAIVSVIFHLVFVSAVRDVRNDANIFTGWSGSDYQPDGIPEPGNIEHRVNKMKVLDADARIFLMPKFLSDEEADHIRGLAEPRLARSGVVAKTGGSEISQIRTSHGVFLDRGEDDVIKRIEERISRWTLMPVENGEGLQVLRYNKEQEYKAHWDYFFHADGLSNGGNRYSTVLMYLADTEEGGETVFPNIPAPGGVNEGFSECAKYNLAAKPRKGDAILFHSIKPTGELERKSLHTACPVIKGQKWSAAKWIHVGHYAMGGEPAVRIEQKPQPDPRDANLPAWCKDSDAQCYEWAQSGECERNPGFMIGSRARPGKCLKSCRKCDLFTESGAEKTFNQDRSDNSYKY